MTQQSKLEIVMFSSGTIGSSLTYRILSIAKQLVARGHKVSIIAPSSDKYSNFVRETFLEVAGVRIVRPFQWNVHGKNMFNFIPYFFHVAWKMLWCQADIIYLYKPTPITIIGLLPKVLRSTPVLLDLDDLGSDVMEVEQNSGIAIRLVRWCESLASAYCSSMVVVSRFLFEENRKLFPNKKIIIVPNGTEVVRYQEKKDVSEQVSRRVTVLGSFNKVDFLNPLLEVLPNVIHRVGEGVRVLVLGSGKYLGHLANKAEQLGIVNNIEFLGWISKDEFVTYIRPGDIGYCYTADTPTNRACSNQKVFDYMALGAVPFVSAVGDLPVYVDYGEAGYVIPAGNLKALEDGLVEALTDGVGFFERNLRAQKRVKSLYDWSFLVRHIESELLRLKTIS